MTRTNRREFLKAAAAGAALLPLPAIAHAATTKATPPPSAARKYFALISRSFLKSVKLPSLSGTHVSGTDSLRECC